MPKAAKRSKPKQITLDELRRDHKRAAALARSAAGVRVVDADGNLRFTLWIPPTPLPATR